MKNRLTRDQQRDFFQVLWGDTGQLGQEPSFHEWQKLDARAEEQEACGEPFEEEPD